MEEDSYSHVSQNYPKVVRTRGYKEEQEKGCGHNSDLTASKNRDLTKFISQGCHFHRAWLSVEKVIS